MEMKGIDKLELDKLIKENEIVIVDFFAPWCGPCQMFYPVFDKVSKTSDVKMVKVDVDQNPDSATLAEVQGIPTVVAYKKGKIVDRFSGYVSDTQLISFVKAIKNK